MINDKPVEPSKNLIIDTYLIDGIVRKAAIDNPRISIFLRPVKWVNCTISGRIACSKNILKLTLDYAMETFEFLIELFKKTISMHNTMSLSNSELN